MSIKQLQDLDFGGVAKILNLPGAGYAYVGTWAARPTTGLTTGDKAVITDYGAVGRSEWFWSGTRWTRDTPLILYQSGAIDVATASATEVQLLAVPVKGGSMGLNGSVRVQAMYTFPNNANNKSLFMRIGAGTFSTAFALLWNNDVGSGSQITTSFKGFRNANSESAQRNTNAQYTWGFGTTNVTMATAAVNTAADFNVFLSGLIAGGSTLTLRQALVELIPG